MTAPCLQMWLNPSATLTSLADGTGPGVWLKIPGRVRLDSGVTFRRGRTGQTETSAAGSLTLTLDNTDGVFTPGQESALTAYLLGLAADQGLTVLGLDERPLRDMPIMLTYSASSAHKLWQGVVTGVRVAWAGGSLAQAVITATDLVAQLARTQMRQMPVQACFAHGATVCYPLDEEDGIYARPATTDGLPLTLGVIGSGWGAQDFAWNVGHAPGSRIDDPERGAASWTGSGTANGWTLDTGPHWDESLPGVGLSTGPVSATVHAMLMPSTPGLTRTAVAWQGRDGSVEIGTDALTKPFARVTTTDATVAITGDTVTTGIWHHVAVTVDYDLLDTVVRLYVDGVEVASGSVGSYRPLPSNLGAVRVRVGAGLGTWVPQPWQGRVANVAAHDGLLSTSAIADLAAGRDGWTGDTSTARMARIAAYALRTPSVAASTPVGRSTLCAQHTDGQTAGQALDDAAAAEAGWWGVSRTGAFRGGSRGLLWKASPDATIAATDLDAGIEFVCDADGRITEVHASRPGGAAVRRRGLPAADGIVYSRSVELVVDSDPQLNTLAAWLVSAANADPEARSETVAVDLVACDAAVGSLNLHTLDVGALLRITGLPATAPAAEVRLAVTGITDRVTATSWLRTFNVVDAPPWVDVWVLGTDALGVGTRLAL